jgi:hypothetical protein
MSRLKGLAEDWMQRMKTRRSIVADFKLDTPTAEGIADPTQPPAGGFSPAGAD